MNRVAFLVSAATAALVAYACSSNTTTPPATDAGSTPDAQATDASVGADAPAVDAPVAVDAHMSFVDGSMPQGGFPSTPNLVDCAGSTCATPANYCCVPTNTADASTATCAAFADLSACAGGAHQECNEAADCPNGKFCCVGMIAGPFTESTCADNCEGTSSRTYQACRINGECLNGESCHVYDCHGHGKWELCSDTTPVECQ